jgi:hypothetical protein
LKGNDQLRGTILRTIVEYLGINLFIGTHERYVVLEERNDSDFPEQSEDKNIFMEKYELRTLRNVEGEIAEDWYAPFYPDYVDWSEFPANFEITCREIIQSDPFSRAADTMGDSGFLGNGSSGAEYW